MEQSTVPTNRQRMSLSLDYRIVCLLLLAAIAAMLFIWKPWHKATTDRTIEVTGQATITAKPDEFIFSPTYQFENADKQAALAQLTAKSNEIVTKLKSLGVADSKIKTNSDSW